MPSNTQFSMRIDETVKEKLERYSKRIDRSQSYIAARALEEYLDEHEARYEAMQAGKKAIAEGRYFTQSQTEEWLSKWEQGITAPSSSIKK